MCIYVFTNTHICACEQNIHLKSGASPSEELLMQPKCIETVSIVESHESPWKELTAMAAFQRGVGGKNFSIYPSTHV